MTILIKVPSDFRIIAHRGGRSFAPENTISAFRISKEKKIKEVELDTRLTSDGIVVLCHDETLDRYGYPSLTVESMTYRELKKLDMGSWFSSKFKNTSMLALKDLYNEFGKSFTYHVELKGLCENLPEIVFSLTKDSDLLENTIFTSFSFEQLSRMRNISDKVRLSWLVDSINKNVLLKAKEVKLFQICPAAQNLQKEEVSAGLSVVDEIRAWGVNGTVKDVAELTNRLVILGVKGITTINPDWFQK